VVSGSAVDCPERQKTHLENMLKVVRYYLLLLVCIMRVVGWINLIVKLQLHACTGSYLIVPLQIFLPDSKST